MDIEFFLGVVGLYVLVVIYELVRARQNGRFKLRLKETVNHWCWLVHLIGTMYFIVWGVLQIPGVAEWSNFGLAAHPEYTPDRLTYYVYAGAPFVATIAIVAIAWWFLMIGFKPWLKYSEQELEWREREKSKSREKLQRWFGKKVGAFLVK